MEHLTSSNGTTRPARQAFWNGKRVLVTGHTGFKGSWLSLWLQRLGASVTGYALPSPTQPSLFEDARVAAGMASVIGDVRDLDRMARLMREHDIEIVFHLAAQPLVRYSYAHPAETYAVNVMGTVNVLEAARMAQNVRAIVAVTTDKCYENREWHWGYRETDPMGGHDPYSSSKGCAELVAAAYRRSFLTGADGGQQIALATARAGNVIGGGDWAVDRLIPDVIRAFSDGQPVRLRHPHATRPWQHVLEPLGGYLTLAEHLWRDGDHATGGWNFGPNDDDAQPVGWIVDQMQRLWGDGARWQLDGTTHPHEATYLKLDCSKAKALLGWTPRLDLATALRWTVEWYQHHRREDTDLHALTLAHIARYEGASEAVLEPTEQAHAL